MIMEGNKGGGRVGHDQEDMGDGMQCNDHPYRNNPGGICPICLQEKLGKLVSSSFPVPIRVSSSSSPSPSFRSDIGVIKSGSNNNINKNVNGGVVGSSSSSTAVTASLSLALSSVRSKSKQSSTDHDEYYIRRTRIPFLLARKKKKVTVSSSSTTNDVVLRRSKSTATPRRANRASSVFLDNASVLENFSPRKRGGFWSFLYLSSTKSSSSKKSDKISSDSLVSNTSKVGSFTSTTTTTVKETGSSSGKNRAVAENNIVEEDDSPNSQTTASATSFERKVSRSRSVGCGSRSFSGDFFERISTGFGDCTLRRVESQREGKSKASASSGSHQNHHCIKERVRCGGLFGGFMLTSSSSSSSSSNSYWVSSSSTEEINSNGKSSMASANSSSSSGALAHGRNKSWTYWAFASPMRAFGNKPSSKDGKRDIIRQANNNSDKNSTTPNLSAIPSLLAVRG